MCYNDAKQQTLSSCSSGEPRLHQRERQWSDIRRAAALAQEKGVRLTLHGVSVMPADSTHAGGSPQRATAEQAKRQGAAPR